MSLIVSRHWVVAAASALLGAIAGGLALSEPHQVASSALLAGTMGAIAMEDFQRLRVPNTWNLLAALGGIVSVLLEARSAGTTVSAALIHAALGVLLCGGGFYVLREAFFRLRKAEGLGLGDVKLAATGGIWLGWELMPAAVTLAALAAIVFVAIAVVREQSWARERRIPLAAFLAPAIWLCWFSARLAPL